MNKIAVRLTVNGQEVVAEVKPQMTLLEFLRTQLGLVGAKNGCARGHCGACTVIVNGQARRSCLLPMARMDGTVVETIEGLAPNGHLHPLQEAFLAAGAVQCGFCTPGMIMAAKALLDRNPDPSEHEIKEALKHNLCRCTGYVKIIKAVRMAAAALSGRTAVSLAFPQESDVVGRSVPRVDGLAKVKGEPLYTDDFRLEGALEGRALRSPYPHAEILSIDVSAARRAPGIKAVLTAADIPGRKTFGLITPHQPVLAEDRVRYVGDPVALVLGETSEEVEEALKLIKVEYRPLEVIDSPFRALEEHAPDLHEGGNVLAHIKVRKGNIETGFAQADVVLEGDYYVPFIEHGYLEPEAALARVGEDGVLTVWCPSQSSFAFQKDICATLNLPEEKVRVIYRPAGGAFGGREEPTVQILCALGAWVTGRPVRMVMTREESIAVSTKRHAEYLHYRLGATRQGKLTVLEARIIGDTGAYASAGEAVLFRSAAFAGGPYEIPHAKVDAFAVYTNHPPGGAMRGFGSTQPTFAMEVMMDRLAEALGLDPFTLRELNGWDVGKKTLTGQILDHSVGFKETLAKVKEALSKEDLPQPRPGRKRGIGIAAAVKNVGLGSGMVDGAGAILELTTAGELLVKVGCVDTGQGSDTAMAQIAAEATGVPFSAIRVLASDTHQTLDGGVTTASRQTFVSGNAVRIAGGRFRSALLEFVSQEIGYPAEKLTLKNGGVEMLGNTQRISLTLQEIAALAQERGQALRAEYFYIAPRTYPLKERCDNEEFDFEEYRLHFAYCFGTQAAVVEVDEETGEVEVLKVIAAHDVGRPINPLAVEGQIEGAVMMGLGYALSEEFRLKGGQVETNTLAKLRLPKITQTPEIEVLVVDDYHPFGPYGAKGMGELPLNPTAPAIINAIYNAVGVRINSLPATREKIKELMGEKKGITGPRSRQG
ncbi:putative xanthine dehydrogenase subunit D [Neomoorella glycerini]|uniref:Putative xanthine dehydrogenase subunit D n=1 Tax=Neomoorella glycerini TaxID=55779 RepID=A0A6I5ZTW4_9FIRM|nr:molybdopterin cofactor-binding domain-containing protein [Moorella glycerini]QGP93128.1 putative xanthine dehydrogenase subunit D [Moorella glycerini]